MYDCNKKPGACPPVDPCAPCNPCGPDFPNFCPPPAPHPAPYQPPCPSVVEGNSLYEAVNNLTNRVNTCMATYNDVMANCYKTLHNLECAAQENGAYYDCHEVWTETGYQPDESATYTIIHKNVVDRKGEPIRMQLHLAYGNTTNSQITQNLFSASEITLADKIVPAIPLTGTGWYGNAIINGCPIPSTEASTYYTVGFTKKGVMRYYPNSVSVDQMLKDTIENAMGCSGVLIINSQIANDAFFEHIPNATEQKARIVMGQNYDTREVMILVCGQENNVDKKGLTSKACAEILLQYGCDIAVELAEGDSAGACDKGQLMFVPDNNNVPETYAFWYISRKCYYCNDYQRELAKLMQNYGTCLWQTYLNKKKIEQLREDLNTEISNREDADQVLQNQILEEVENRVKADEVLQNQILEEVQNRVNADNVLQEQILAEVENRVKADEVLQNQILAEVDDRKNADDVLQNQILEEVNARKNADEVLQNQILEETKNRIAADDSLQNQLITETNARVAYDENLQAQITKEVTDRTNADAVLHQEILTEQGERISADEILQKNINEEAATRAEEDTKLQGNIDAETTARQQADATLQSNIDALAQRVTVLETDIDQLQTLYNSLQEQTAAMDTAITSIQKTIASIETSLNNVKTSIDNITNGTTVLPYLPIKGGTMQGSINMNNKSITNVPSPSADGDAVNKKYVDDAIAGGITPPTGDYLPLSGGTMTGNINMNGNRVTSVGDPSAGTDAVNKDYVDEEIAKAGDGKFLPLKGGALTGAVTTTETSFENNELVTKSYVDSQISTAGNGKFLPLAGGTMTGAINMGNQKVTAVAAPTAGTDAANKTYVDNAISTAAGNYIAKNNGSATGTTTFENISVAGDTVLDQVEVQTSITVPTPTDNTDAANKQYVDNAVASASYTLPAATATTLGGVKVGSGLSVTADGTLSSSGISNIPIASASSLGGIKVGESLSITNDGTLSVVASNNPSNNNMPVNKEYVDSKLGNFVEKTGDTMTGDLIMDNQHIYFLNEEQNGSLKINPSSIVITDYVDLYRSSVSQTSGLQFMMEPGQIQNVHNPDWEISSVLNQREIVNYACREFTFSSTFTGGGYYCTAKHLGFQSPLGQPSRYSNVRFDLDIMCLTPITTTPTFDITLPSNLFSMRQTSGTTTEQWKFTYADGVYLNITVTTEAGGGRIRCQFGGNPSVGTHLSAMFIPWYIDWSVDPATDIH